MEVNKQVEASPLKRRAASPESTAPVPPRVPLYRFEDYSELSQEARDLDAALLPHLRAIITGSKRGLLDHLAFPLFTQGMMILHQHFKRDKCSCITQAFSLGQQLRFTGDTKEYQIQLYSFVDQLLSTNATIYDFILACVIDSDLPSSVKYSIARDINEKDISNINIFDMIEGYCADISAVSGSSEAPIVLNASPTAAVCERCGRTGHPSDTCWSPRHVSGKRLDSKTMTKRAKELKDARSNKIDIFRLSTEEKEQLMANLTLSELENKGKITKYTLFYILSRLSK